MTIHATARQTPAASLARGRYLRIGVEVLMLLFLLSMTVPSNPFAFQRNNAKEYSWELLMHVAAATGMQFGKQIVMPEGPLAFLGSAIYEPHTYPFLVGGWAVMAAVAFWSVWELGRKYIRTWQAAAVWLVAVMVLMGFSPDCFFPDCAFLLILNYFLVHGRKLSGSSIAMLVLLGAASLIKTNILLYSGIAVLVLIIDQAIQRRRHFYLPGGIYLAATAFFYLAARQSPSSLGSFLHGWWLVLLGHAEGSGSAGPLRDAILDLLLSAAVAWLVAGTLWKTLRWSAAAPAAGIGLTLVLLYKHSFVRQDQWHVGIAPAAMLTLLLFYIPAIWPSAARRRRHAAVAIAACTAVFFYWVQVSYGQSNWFGFCSHALGDCRANIRATVWHVTDPDRLIRLWDADREFTRKQAALPLDKIVGTVDVYPHWQNVIFAYGFPYAPRPVCISYVANTPALNTLNARHLASPDAAETILFDLDEVDGKYLTLLDGASIPELLARYNLIDDSGSMLILRKAARPRRVALIPLGTSTTRLGKYVDVPASPSGIIWARIAFRHSLLDKLAAAFYRPATLQIAVRTAGGALSPWHLLPDLAGQGFVLSPLIDDRKVMADVFKGVPSKLLDSKRVTSMDVEVLDGQLGAGCDPEFTVSFYCLRIEPVDGH